MRNNTTIISVNEIISALFILLFVYTGITKLYEHHAFQFVLSQSPLIKTSAKFISWFIPIVELVMAVLLFFPFTRTLGIIVSLVLMCIFTTYIAYMIKFTPDLPCSCGGVLKQMTWRQHLVFNIFFTILASLSLWDHLKNKRIIAISRTSRIPV